jgi:hypothetical protein
VREPDESFITRGDGSWESQVSEYNEGTPAVLIGTSIKHKKTDDIFEPVIQS